MTENEAKTKWCPMVRYVIANDKNSLTKVVNRSYENINCIGSDCMMWRNEVYEDTDDVIGGYCGLGGKP